MAGHTRPVDEACRDGSPTRPPPWPRRRRRKGPISARVGVRRGLWLARLRDLAGLRKLGIQATRAAPYVVMDGYRPPQQMKLF